MYGADGANTSLGHDLLHRDIICSIAVCQLQKSANNRTTSATSRFLPRLILSRLLSRHGR
jgi:hypothetical protein